MTITVTGSLFNFEELPAAKQRLHVHDAVGKYVASGKIGHNGSFSLQLPKPAESAQRVSYVFHVHAQKSTLDGSRVAISKKLSTELCKDLAFIKESKKTGQATAEILYDPAKLSYSIEKIFLQKVYNSNPTPVSYMVSLGLATLPAKILSLWARFKSYLFASTVSDVFTTFGFPTTPLTEENCWKLITNGICPLPLQIKNETITAEINWDRYEFDKPNSVPDIKVIFKKKKGEDPAIQEIKVRFRKELQPTKNNEKWVSYKPQDTNFEEGLRIANSAFHLWGQAVYHLGMGHVYGTQVAGPAFDCLQGHVLGSLLLPHCEFIQTISGDLGKTAIFGEHGVLNASGLSEKGIATLIADTVRLIDPFTFSPQEPITDTHFFAKAQKFHFSILQKAVKEFFDDNWDAMKNDWSPIHTFFRKLHKRSPEFFKEKKKDTYPIKRSDYKNDKCIRSMRPICCDPEKPQEGDRKQMEEFCVHLIFHNTLWHSWLHRSQYTELPFSPSVLDLNFAPISLNEKGKAPFGGISVDEAIKEAEILTLFKQFNTKKYSILGSESKVSSHVKRYLQSFKEVYRYLGMPLSEMQVTTVI